MGDSAARLPPPLDETTILDPHADSTRTGRQQLINWLLILALVVLQASPLRKQYHCEITGSSSLLCCGVEDAPDTAGCRPSSCCNPEPGERPPNGDDCDCCEVTYEKDGQPALKSDSSRDGETEQGSPTPYFASGLLGWAPSARAPAVRPSGAEPALRHRVPVYLLHCLFLI